MCHIFLYPFLGWGASRLVPGSITNNAAMNIVEYMSLWYECSSSGYMPKSDIEKLEKKHPEWGNPDPERQI